MQRGGDAPWGAVLHDDHRGGTLVEERAHTSLEQPSGVVIDHDGADHAWHREAQYSLVKRYFTRVQRAANPSRQVIFLPSSNSRPE